MSEELNGRDLYLIEVALNRFMVDLAEDSKKFRHLEYRRREVSEIIAKVKTLSVNAHD